MPRSKAAKAADPAHRPPRAHRLLRIGDCAAAGRSAPHSDVTHRPLDGRPRNGADLVRVSPEKARGKVCASTSTPAGGDCLCAAVRVEPPCVGAIRRRSALAVCVAPRAESVRGQRDAGQGRARGKPVKREQGRQKRHCRNKRSTEQADATKVRGPHRTAKAKELTGVAVAVAGVPGLRRGAVAAGLRE